MYMLNNLDPICTQENQQRILKGLRQCVKDEWDRTSYAINEYREFIDHQRENIFLLISDTDRKIEELEKKVKDLEGKLMCETCRAYWAEEWVVRSENELGRLKKALREESKHNTNGPSQDVDSKSGSEEN